MTAFTDKMLECLCAEVNQSIGGPVCWCGMVPGAQVAMDHCGPCTSGGQCGQAWFRLNRAYGSNRFPQPVFDATSCQAPLAYEWQAGVWRCVPVWDGGEDAPPTVPQQLTASLIQISDMQAVYRAILCCVTDEAALGQYTPVGPNGGCGGGFWTFATRQV